MYRAQAKQKYMTVAAEPVQHHTLYASVLPQNQTSSHKKRGNEKNMGLATHTGA
jgi:hypothetical protein